MLKHILIVSIFVGCLIGGACKQWGSQPAPEIHLHFSEPLEVEYLDEDPSVDESLEEKILRHLEDDPSINIDEVEIIWEPAVEADPYVRPRTRDGYNLGYDETMLLDLDRLIDDYGTPTPATSFFLALWSQESDLRLNAPMGDGDNIAPCFQIRPAYFEDSRVEGPITGPYDEMLIVDAYMWRYAPEMMIELTEDANAQVISMLARIHNGGPNGYAYPDTVEYGQQVAQIAATLRTRKSTRPKDDPYYPEYFMLEDLFYEVGRLSYPE